MTCGSSEFLYENEFQVVMAVIDADMLQDDKELNLEINACIKNMP